MRQDFSNEACNGNNLYKRDVAATFRITLAPS